MTFAPSSKSNQMVLVTGASGMIGRAVTEKLLSQGLAVRAQVRNRASFMKQMESIIAQGNIEIQEADFTNISEREFNRLAKGCCSIVHTAALVHQPQAAFEAYELLNVRTTRQLAEIAAACGVSTFVFLSTANVYGEGPFDYIDEEAQVKPKSPYAVSKANSEQWLTSSNVFKRLVILRPPLVFGEGDRGNLIKIIKQIKLGRYFHIGSPPVKKSVIYSKDLASIITTCLSQLTDGTYLFNAANPQPIELKDLTERIAHCLGREATMTTVPRQLVEIGAKLAQVLLKERSPITVSQIDRLTTTTTCSVARLVKATNFFPVFSLPDAIKNEISWAESVGLL